MHTAAHIGMRSLVFVWVKVHLARELAHAHVLAVTHHGNAEVRILEARRSRQHSCKQKGRLGVGFKVRGRFRLELGKIPFLHQRLLLTFIPWGQIH